MAVIPKGFHQPMTDFRNDPRIGAMLLREVEEELFGRTGVDNTLTQSNAWTRCAPPRLSEPIRWLVENPGALRMECPGCGLN